VGSSPAGCGLSRSNHGPVALCTLAGPGLTQPSILSESVNEYRLRLGIYKGKYVRRCLVRPMYLSASVVAVSTWALSVFILGISGGGGDLPSSQKKTEIPPPKKKILTECGKIIKIVAF